MTESSLHELYVVEFSNEVDEKVYVYVSPSWIVDSVEINVVVALPTANEISSEFDPDFLKQLPPFHWKRYQGTIVHKTDSIQEAIQMVKLKNNFAEVNPITSSPAAIANIINNSGANLLKINEHGSSSSLGLTSGLDAVSRIGIISPIVASLDKCITDVMKISKDNPIIRQELEKLNQACRDDLIRLKTSSNNYAKFFQNNMKRRINCLIAKMQSSTTTPDQVMLENTKIFSELMSNLLVTLSFMNGEIK